MDLLRRYSNQHGILADLDYAAKSLDRALRQPAAPRRSVSSTAPAPPRTAEDRLGEDRVAELIWRYETVTAPELAKEYGISLSAVKRLLRRHKARLKDRTR